MKKRTIIDLLIIFLIGLIPILWTSGGYIILGHDSGLPLDPFTHFVDRLHIWSQRFGLGADQNNLLLGAFFIHGFEALISLTNLPLAIQQKIQFVFWFMLPGFSMYFLARKLWPEKINLPLIASVIYMVNFYLIQGWFVAERTKFSIYIALPLIFYFSLDYLLGKRNFLSTILLSGLVLGIFNGGGSIPIYGGLILVLFVLFVYINVIYLSLDILKRTLLLIAGLGVIYVALNSYWLVPYLYYVASSYGRDLANAGGADGVLTWATYLSKGSSLFNLIRGQGIPEWYLNDFHPYAKNFFTNPILIIYSFIFPVTVVLSLLIAKRARDKFILYLLLIIALVAIILSAGPTSPYGFIFEGLVRFMPGFAMFRSVYYKFSYAMWFSFSILVAFSIDYIIEYLKKRTKKIFIFSSSSVLIFVFIVSYLTFHYPVLTGQFLDYNSDPSGKLTTRVKVPEYVLDFGKWIKTQNQDKRFLIVPELDESGYISYSWGYWSLAPLNSLIARNSFVQNNSLFSGNEKTLMKEMYTALLNRDFASFNDFVELFGIDSIVLQKDTDWKNKHWGTTDPEEYEKILAENPNFVLDKQFGAWTVYGLLNKKKSNRISTSDTINFSDIDLSRLVSFPFFNPNVPLYNAPTAAGVTTEFANLSSNIFIGADCIDCLVDQETYDFQLYNPKVLPGSLLYYFIEKREVELRKASSDFPSKVNFLLTTSDRKIVEAKWMVEFKQNLTQLSQTLTKYRELLKELQEQVKKGAWEMDIDAEQNLTKTIQGHLRVQAGLADSIHNNGVMTLESRIILSTSYEIIKEINQIMRAKYALGEYKEKNYVFNIPIKDYYDVYVKKSSVSNPALDIGSIQVQLGSQNTIMKPVREDSGWIYFGRSVLDFGRVGLKITDSTFENIASNISAETSASSGFFKQEGSYILTVDSLNKCLNFPLNNLDIGEDVTYAVSFKYKNHLDRKILSFYIDKAAREETSMRSKDAYLPATRQWTNFITTYAPTQNNIKLNFCNGFIPINEEFSEAPLLDDLATRHGIAEGSENQNANINEKVAEIKDITVYKISSPNVILYSARERGVVEREEEISYSKVSPVEYKFNLPNKKRPLFVTLRETYADKWNICEEGKNCLDSNGATQFANAGLVNTWYLKNDTKGKLRFYYAPQKRFEAGIIITIISIGTVIYLIASKFRRKNILTKSK